MRKVILVGNPNTGKTTLFNTLTSSSEHAGNWHGVTVDVKEKNFKISGKSYTLCDLPGLYSLDAYSEEERLSRDYILNNPDALIVLIVDANNLRRNLLLALEVKDIHKKMIIALNMAREVKPFDIKQLEAELSVSVIPIDARKKRGTAALSAEIERVFKSETGEKKTLSGEDKKLNLSAAGSPVAPNSAKTKPSAAKPLARGDAQNKSVGAITGGAARGLSVGSAAMGAARGQGSQFSIDEFERRERARFNKIDQILSSASYKSKSYYGFSKFDRFIMNPFVSFISFSLVMMLVFYITFGAPGSFLSGLIGDGFEFIKQKIMAWLSAHTQSVAFLEFIDKGVLGGALTVLSFMPQIVLLFFCINFLEDIGYLSRVALMFDGLFKKLGLTGRSIFSLIMGFGCTTTAVMTTRNLDNKNLKKRTAILLPFMSCSAKLPIFAVIISAFFTKHKALIVFGLYMLSIILMLIVALIIKSASRGEEKNTFMLEMPKYRMVSLKKVVKDALKSAGDFLIRVGGILLLASIVVFFLYNYSITLCYVGSSGQKSILELIAGFIRYIFVPLGFSSVGATIAILSGLVAKEMVVSALTIVNAATALELADSLLMSTSPVHFTPASAISFLIFILLYPPCISAFFSMKREVGLKTALKSFFLQLGVAYLTSLVFYQMMRLISTRLWWINIVIVFIVALLVYFVIKLLKKKRSYSIETLKLRCLSCGKNCHGNNKL